MANLSTQNIGTNYKGILNLGATINTPLSTTLQAVTDGDGNTTPLQLATNRIALGSGATGTSLLNFPDAGTTAADGISFGTNLRLYRAGSGLMYWDGIEFVLNTGYFRTPNIYGTNTYNNVIQLNTSGITLSPTVINGGTLTGSSATSALSISQIWNTTGNPSLIFANVTNTASGTSANLIDLQVGGVSQFSVSRGGNLNGSGGILANYGNIRATSGGSFDFGSGTRSRIFSPANAQIRFTAADGTALSAVESLYERYGSGSPEGVVTAPIGAIYHRTDGGAGTSLYVKESGTGDTGWSPK